MTNTITDLLGENLAGDELGEDADSLDLIAGYIPGRAVEYIPPMQLGDGLAGPPNDQQLQIFRDTRPLAVDELGMQGPFRDGPKLARHRAGRSFPLNYEWNGSLDPGMQELVPAQDVLTISPFDPGQDPSWHDGVMPPEVLPATYTVPYTASPSVGFTDYR